MRTIPRTTTETFFVHLHRRACDGGYRRPPWEALDASTLSPGELAEHRAGWEARAAAEYRSMLVFTELIARFAEAGLPLEVTCAASRLVQDEARHTELCARVAEALGGSGAVALPGGSLRLADDGLPARLFVARWTVSMFCVGESASVGLLRALVAHATDPCVRAVLATLLRDELLHDRFGWSLARLMLPRLDPGEREWLEADLSGALAHYERVNACCLRPDGGQVPEGPEPARPNLGVLPREHFARAFYERLDRVILPRLAALGVPAYRAWARRHEAPP